MVRNKRLVVTAVPVLMALMGVAIGAAKARPASAASDFTVHLDVGVRLIDRAASRDCDKGLDIAVPSDESGHAEKFKFGDYCGHIRLAAWVAAWRQPGGKIKVSYFLETRDIDPPVSVNTNDMMLDPERIHLTKRLLQSDDISYVEARGLIWFD